MRPKHLFTSMIAAVALLAASCSTSKVATNRAIEDDVYNTTAKAKVYKPAAAEVYYQEDSTSYGDYYGKTNPSYDMDYTSRIDRFYYGNQWRSYYDPYYNYYGYNDFYGYNNSFGYGNYWGGSGFYNNWMWGAGWGGYYGGLLYNPYWGPYSSYNYWGTGYYGGGLGWGGGGYYGGGIYTGRNENYGPRPTRSGSPRPGTNYGNGVPSRGSAGSTVARPSREGSYNPTNGQARGGQTGASRPSRQTESRPTYTPPSRTETPASRPSYTPPPSSSGSSSSGSSSGGGGGGARPTRGGRG